MEDALAANADVVLRIDVQGAATVRRMMPNAVSIFLVSISPVWSHVRAALMPEIVSVMAAAVRTADGRV